MKTSNQPVRYSDPVLSHPLLGFVLLRQLLSLQSQQTSVDPRHPAAQRQQQVHDLLQVSCKHNQVSDSDVLRVQYYSSCGH